MFYNIGSNSGLSLNRRIRRHKLILVPAASLILFVLAFLAIPYLEATFKASAADTATTLISATISDPWATLTTSGDVNLESGALTSKKTLLVQNAVVTASTNSPAGYRLYLSGNNAELGQDGTTTYSNLTSGYTHEEEDPSNPGSTIDVPFKISSIEVGAGDTAVALSTANTWGYAVKGDTAKSGFNTATVNYTNIDGSVSKFTEVADINARTFKGIIGNDGTSGVTTANAIIAESSSASTADRLDVYYGALVNTTTPAGTYSAEVTYTMIADYVSEDDPNDEGRDPLAPVSPANPNEGEYAYTAVVDGAPVRYYYTVNANGNAGVYHYDGDGNKITAYGVNKTVEDEAEEIATIGNINDGNITWAAVAIVAGASATFLAIALLRDRDDDEDEEEV